MDLLNAFISGLFALVIELFGLSLLFSDLGPGETWANRVIMLVALYAVSGLIIGYINPKLWMIAGLTARGTVLLGIVGLINVLLAA